MAGSERSLGMVTPPERAVAIQTLCISLTFNMGIEGGRVSSPQKEDTRSESSKISIT